MKKHALKKAPPPMAGKRFNPLAVRDESRDIRDYRTADFIQGLTDAEAYCRGRLTEVFTDD